jgi:hypothetical protein
MVTSTHVHLLLLDNGGRDVIPRTLQLIAGRTGQEYNQRKSRQGAFWEDRYHATAVQSDDHLIRCLTYIDLNMVRAGVVAHPSEWSWSGYNEIQTPKARYTLINRTKLMALLGMPDEKALSEHHREWINEALEKHSCQRDSRWAESVAVGSKAFIEQTKEQLGFRAKGREIQEDDRGYALREASSGYDFAGKNSPLRADNAYVWDHIL